MKIQRNDLSEWFDSLDDCKPDFTPIKVWSLLQFFTLRQKTPREVIEKVKSEATELFELEKERGLSIGGATSIIRNKYGLPPDENINILRKDNLCPIPDLQYLVFSPPEERYYIKQFRGYSVDELYFYRQTLTFSGESTPIENLRRFVSDNHCFCLLTETQVQEMKEMLDRVYRANMKEGTGELKYKTFIKLLELHIDMEDYKTYSWSLTGFKTVINQYEVRISEAWRSCLKN
jgi:hypothetical protein